MATPTATSGAPLLEREGELARLREVLDAAAHGHGGAAVVVGPAGIGKTSLLTATREAATESGFRVLAARGG
ncbi:MAG TPA: AAA family ATPase, partial [Baekduia sp.]|nr:AAA family ATPase [Baekduia sp.]